MCKERSKAQGAALSRLWNELCLRESQARIRNGQLLRDFSVLEARLADLSARTDALRRRKTDYEKFLQHLWTDLQEAKRGSMRQTRVSNHPLQHLRSPFSPAWNTPHPYETSDQGDQLQCPPFETMPAWAPPVSGRLWPGYEMPVYSQPSAMAPSFHRNFSSPRWAAPRGHLVETGGFPQGWHRPGMARIPECQPLPSSWAGHTIKNERTTGVPTNHLLSGGDSGEEQNSTSVRTRKDHSRANTAQGISPSVMHFGAAPGQFGLLRRSVGQDGSAPRAFFPDETESGHGVAERASGPSPRQRRMQAKPRDPDTMPLNKPSTQIPLERPLEHKEKETGTEEIWARRALVSEAQGDGGCRGKQRWEEGRKDRKEGESAGRPDVGRGQVDGECEVPEEEASAGKETEPLGSGLTDRQDGSEPEEGEPEGTRRADGCEDEEGGDGEIWGPSQEGENGMSRVEETQEGVSVEEEEGVPEGRHGERGKKKEDDDGGQASKDGSEPHGDEGGRNGNHGQKTGLEWDLGSQAKEAGGPEEEVSSASSSSVLVSLGARHHGPSQQEDDDERSGNPSLQNGSPVEAQRTEAGTNSTGEGQEEEEEEEEEEVKEDSEGDTDIEAALAPHHNKPLPKDQRTGGAIQRLQELWDDVEDTSKVGDQEDEDDFMTEGRGKGRTGKYATTQESESFCRRAKDLA